MALLKAHWKLAALHFLLVCLGAGVLVGLLLRHSAPKANAQVAPNVPAAPAAPTVQPLDPVTYSRLQVLRRQVGLTNMDLAAMGCSQSQASAVLTALQAWYQSNQGAWDKNEQAAITAKRDLQEIWRRINLGPKDDTVLSALPGKQQAVAAAIQQQAQLLQSSADAVSGQLSSSQAPVWATIRSNAALQDPLRYAPHLTSEQLQSINLARAKGPAMTTGLLSAAQQAAIMTALGNQQNAFAGVAAADAAVLPAPVPANSVP